MLCTQMRLAERRDPRFTLPPQQSTGIIQRPCLVNNLENSNTTKNASHNKNDNNNDFNNFEFLTPRTDRSKKNSKQKPPLIVFSLKMESDVKTLAQDDVKRDPRRLPFFCEQYKQNKKDQQQRNITNPTKDLISCGDPSDKLTNELMVRGVEMLSDPNQYNNINYQELNESGLNEQHDHDIDLYSNKYYNFFGNNDGKNNFENINSDLISSSYPKELMKFKLTDCCQCMRDVKLLKTNNQQINNDIKQKNDFKDNILIPINIKNQIDDNNFFKNQIFNGTLKPPFPSFVISNRSRPLRKIPSPRTRQIISITMHTKK